MIWEDLHNGTSLFAQPPRYLSTDALLAAKDLQRGVVKLVSRTGPDSKLTHYGEQAQNDYKTRLDAFTTYRKNIEKTTGSVNLALSGPLPPNEMKLYSADEIGIDEAKRACRLEMIKIVREVDEVTDNPKVATDPLRNWRYLSPHIFRMLLPIVEKRPTLSPSDVTKVKYRLQADLAAAIIKAKQKEQAPAQEVSDSSALCSSTSPPISSSTVTKQKTMDLKAQINAKKQELNSFRTKLSSLKSSLSPADMTEIQAKLREDLMVEIQDNQRQLDWVKMGLEILADASYVTDQEATIKDKLKADLDNQILIKQREIDFAEREIGLAIREDDVATKEKNLKLETNPDLPAAEQPKNPLPVPSNATPSIVGTPEPPASKEPVSSPQHQPELSVPDTSEQPLSNEWHDVVVTIQNQDTGLVLHLSGDPRHNGSAVVGRPSSVRNDAQKWLMRKIPGEESWTLTDVAGGSTFFPPNPRSRGFLGSFCVIYLTPFHSRP